jgi:myo-inositol-1(or 4)-monophosphatase
MTDVSLPDEELRRIETFAVALARQAGAVLLERSQQVVAAEFKSKDQSDPVTATDRELEQLLHGAIKQAYPSHAVVGEEGANHSPVEAPDVVWVLDPLDGTANFAGGLPLFAVSVGVLHRYRPVAGAMFVSTSHRGRPGVYHARLGGGAFFEDERLSLPPNVGTGRVNLSGSIWWRPYRAWARKARDYQLQMRSLGCMVMEMALVSAGVLTCAVFSRPRAWDVAAGVLLVQEAGGVVLTHAPRREDWHPMSEFEVSAEQRDKPVEALRAWCSPLLIGHRDIVLPMASAFTERRLAFLPRPWPFR